MKKTERLYMRVDKDTKDKIEKIAKQENRSMSNWIENVIVEKLKGENKMKNKLNATNYGTVTYEGKEYILTQQAYIAGINEEPYYLASAIDSEGNEYEVEWAINEETQKAYDEIDRQREAGETPNYSLVEDESNACDWDYPMDVREI